MPPRPVLITGFAPYGGRGTNPAAEIARAFDGRSIGGRAIVGRTLPVSYRELSQRIDALFAETEPAIVISVGLWPGEPMIRIERVGLNVADFEIPDNDGRLVRDEPVRPNGAGALLASLPIRAIETALLGAGIPARVSDTAGTFLCNAALYGFLSAAERMAPAAACGFIHVPYLPAQVAELVGDLRQESQLELHQLADLASMDLAVQLRAIEIAIEVSNGAGR